MSQWTHVAGCIRIDDIEGIMTGISPMVRIMDIFNSCPPPEGSEGPLEVKIVGTREGNSLSWGLAYIWGDLRDYSDEQEIFTWAKAICEQLFVRQCAILIDVEYRAQFIIHNQGEGLTMTRLEKSDG
ncbi:MAG: hypothetical protein M0R06_01395 [Sphaerochaeta sp.]|jgi:hypothetical protein|nr:hypothetical protein [Sphaerochaeta sp.]